MTITSTVRRLALLAATALVVSLLPFAAASAQPEGDGPFALDHPDASNPEISINWSITAYPDAAVDGDLGPSEVLIGRSDLFADNLASGSLQGAIENGRPLLLTGGEALDEDVADEMDRLGGPDAIETVHILGGTEAISEDVVTELEELGYDTVNRFAGETRVETAIAIADAFESDTAILARAFTDGDATQAFADSLAAGAWASEAGVPVLFTQSEVLTGATAAHIEEAGYANIIIVGGESAVSAEVEAEVAELADVERVAGDTRFTTAVRVANERGFEGAPDDVPTILVDGQGNDSWADGFAAANLAGRESYPLVLANSASDELPEVTAAFLAGDDTSDFEAHLTDFVLICGGTTPDDQCVEAANILGVDGDDIIALDESGFTDPDEGPIPPNVSLTDAPELLSVEKGANGIVRFNFDQAVPGIQADPLDFRLYAASGAYVTPDNGEIAISGSTVIARYVTASQSGAVRAGVREGAVANAGGLLSISGDFALRATASQVAPLRPNLISVGNYRFADDISFGTQNVLVDFVFDDDTALTIFNAVETGTPTITAANADDYFQLVGQNSQLFPADGAADPVATTEDGITTVTVAFADDPTDVPQTQLRRGVFQTDNPAGIPTADNIIYAASFGSTQGTTVDPDLVSITREGRNAANSGDIYRFTFDEAVSATVLNGANFYVADSAGNVTQSGPNPPSRSAAAADGATVVRAEFLGAANSAVHGFVDTGAVLATDSTSSESGGFNRPDSSAITIPTIGDPEPGVTALPDLIEAERFQDEVTGRFSIVLTFDEAITLAEVNLSDITLYDENGVAFSVDTTAGAAGLSVDDDEVTVTSDNLGVGDDELEATVTVGVQTTAGSPAAAVITEGQADAATLTVN